MARKKPLTSISSKHGFEMQGLEGMIRALTELPREVRKQTAVSALTVAAQPILADMRSASEFSDQSGELRDSIVLKVRKNSVAIRAGGKKAWYAIFVEFGRGKTRKGRSQTRGAKGIARPRPFFRNAFDKNATRSLNIMAEELRRMLAGTIRRYTR